MLSIHAKNIIRTNIAKYSLDYGVNADKSRQVATELCEIAAIVGQSNSFARLLTSSSATKLEKVTIIDDIFQENVDEITLEIFKNLAEISWIETENLTYSLERISLDAWLKSAEIQGTLKVLEDQVLQFYQIVLHNNELRNAFASESNNYYQKKQLLSSLLEDGGAKETLGVLTIAIEALSKIPFLMSVRWILGKIAKRRIVFVANLNTSFAITEKQSGALQKILENKLEKQVQLNIIFDQNALGRLQLDLETRIIDGSLDQKLKSFNLSVK